MADQVTDPRALIAELRSRKFLANLFSSLTIVWAIFFLVLLFAALVLRLPALVSFDFKLSPCSINNFTHSWCQNAWNQEFAWQYIFYSFLLLNLIVVVFNLRKSNSYSDSQIALEIDQLLGTKERLTSLTDSRLSSAENSTELQQIIGLQLAPKLIDFNIRTYVPIKPAWLSIILSALALIATLLLYKIALPLADNLSTASAKELAELLEKTPDLPADVKKTILQLAHAIEVSGLESKESISSLSSAAETVEKAINQKQAELYKSEPSSGQPDTVTLQNSPTPSPTPTANNKSDSQQKEADVQNSKSDNKDQQQTTKQDMSESPQESQKQDGSDSKQETKKDSEGAEGQQDSKEQKSSGQTEGQEKQEGSQGQSGQQGQSGKEGESDQQDQAGKEGQSDQQQKDNKQGSAGQESEQGQDKQQAEEKKESQNPSLGDKGQQSEKGTDKNDKQQSKEGEKDQQDNSQQQGKEQSEQQSGNNSEQKGQGGSEKKDASSKQDQQSSGLNQAKQKLEELQKKMEKENKSASGDKKSQDKQPPESKKESKESEDKKNTGDSASGQDSKPKDKPENSKGSQGQGESSKDKKELDRKQELQEAGDEQLSAQGSGLGDKAKFKDASVEGDQSEKYDERFLGQSTGESDAKDVKITESKVPLEKLDLAKPEAIEEKNSQPVPLEYKDILR